MNVKNTGYTGGKFLPARRSASAVFATATCLSVCPSVCPGVCPSHAGIVPSRAKAGSRQLSCVGVGGVYWVYDARRRSPTGVERHAASQC